MSHIVKYAACISAIEYYQRTVKTKKKDRIHFSQRICISFNSISHTKRKHVFPFLVCMDLKKTLLAFISLIFIPNTKLGNFFVRIRNTYGGVHKKSMHANPVMFCVVSRWEDFLSVKSKKEIFFQRFVRDKVGINFS